MALFGTARDVSLFRHMSRELMADKITEQCGYYKYKLEETKVNYMEKQLMKNIIWVLCYLTV